MLGGAEEATRVVLLTGSQSTAERRKALLDVVSGEAASSSGPHALLQENVDFLDLALVVVDEQHRFGVEQRDALRGKGARRRTSRHDRHAHPAHRRDDVFGDLETSTLRELPAGRAPITTHVVPEDRPGWMERTWARVGEEVRAGRQAYVVCPRIGDDDAPDEGSVIAAEDTDDDAPAPARPLKSVTAVHAGLVEEPSLAGLSVEVLHGRMPPEEEGRRHGPVPGRRDRRPRLDDRRRGRRRRPQRQLMVVMDADRFGVSQLHQLRGRIGRGGFPGLCLLVTGTDAAAAQTRLTAVAGTTDGFELARLDLSQRREGDILGAAQHGRRTQLEFLHILEHEGRHRGGARDAFAVVEADPELAGHPLLAEAVRAPRRRRAGRLPGARLMTRIIAGTHGGRTLRTPPARAPAHERPRAGGTVPALDARGAVRGSHVLDLYAGSGALGWRR